MQTHTIYRCMKKIGQTGVGLIALVGCLAQTTATPSKQGEGLDKTTYVPLKKLASIR